jgi:hypothetical protein
MTVTERNRKSRGRGHYGEYRLARKVVGKVVGRSKAIILDSGKGIKINPNQPPDVVNDVFSFESKYLSNVPASLCKVMTQAKTNAPEGLIPVGVIADRKEHEVFYILMEKDFLDLLVGGK